MAIIGIDLGTTNSLGCVYKDGKPVLIPNKEGSYLTPSAVSVLSDGSVIVGAEAKARKITHPESTALSFKKDMGTDKVYKLGSRLFRPEELSALILRSIAEDAERFLGEAVTEAVISVPAYFHDKQRAATKRAGALAGLKVERILNEPSAAAFGVYQNETEERRFLIFDLGGGTFDVSLVTCLGKIIEIQSVAGNNHLGGDDFDVLMANEFLKEHGLAKENLTAKEYATLVKKARDCKEALTVDDSAKLQIVLSGKAYESTFDMKRMIAASGPLLQKIKDVIGKALKDGNTHASQISNIIMVGGSSKMPLIQSYLRHLFHKAPVVSADCDDKIAQGLAIFCGIREKNPEMKDYTLTDVCPFSLGTNINNPNGKRDLMSTIIPRNSILPVARTHTYSNAMDNQKSIEFRILQGEGMYADENLELGCITAKITPQPKNKEKVHATFRYDINGILVVDIEIPSRNEKIVRVLSETLSSEELKKRAEELAQMAVDPQTIPENKQLMEKLEQLYAQAGPENKDMISSYAIALASAFATGSPVKIQKMKKLVEQFTSQLELWDPMELNFFDADADDWDDPFAEPGNKSDEEEDDWLSKGSWSDWGTFGGGNGMTS